MGWGWGQGQGQGQWSVGRVRVRGLANPTPTPNRKTHRSLAQCRSVRSIRPGKRLLSSS